MKVSLRFLHYFTGETNKQTNNFINILESSKPNAQLLKGRIVKFGLATQGQDGSPGGDAGYKIVEEISAAHRVRIEMEPNIINLVNGNSKKI